MALFFLKDFEFVKQYMCSSNFYEIETTKNYMISENRKQKKMDKILCVKYLDNYGNEVMTTILFERDLSSSE